MSALKGTAVNITSDNFRELSQLCEEFHFRELAAQLSRFRNSGGFKGQATMGDTEARIPIAMRKVNQCGALFEDVFRFTAKGATLECTVGQAVALSPAVREQLSVDACARTFTLIDARHCDAVRGLLSGGVIPVGLWETGLGSQLGSPDLELDPRCRGTGRLNLNSLDLSVLSVEALDDALAGPSLSVSSEDDLLVLLLSLGEEYRPLLRRINMRFLSAAGLAALAQNLAFPLEWAWPGFLEELKGTLRYGLPSGWDSVIIPRFPEIFAAFRQRRFVLLWRGTSDGFGANEFHRRCDGHPNTLTVILDMKGNIFGAFTPLTWDSTSGYKADSTLQSFLFTLKNPHKILPRRFALKATKMGEAIFCRYDWGPGWSDIAVYDNCHANAANFTSRFGHTYNSDVGVDATTFFTGSPSFQVKNIEVLEIIA
jgi:hypothetical protein